jgi:hypothetical protein
MLAWLPGRYVYPVELEDDENGLLSHAIVYSSDDRPSSNVQCLMVGLAPNTKIMCVSSAVRRHSIARGDYPHL